MVIPYGIVEHKLMIAVPPVVADPLVAVDDQCIDSQNLQTSGSSETALTSTCYRVSMTPQNEETSLPMISTVGSLPSS
jgi:hypothetical protein